MTLVATTTKKHLLYLSSDFKVLVNMNIQQKVKVIQDLDGSSRLLLQSDSYVITFYLHKELFGKAKSKCPYDLIQETESKKNSKNWV